MNALTTLTNRLAAKLEIGDGSDLVATLKATAFKGQVTDAQMTALLVVATQYGLNPWTKEIYAFPDRQSGIVPVVGVDGWSRIINNHPQFDGVSFEWDEQVGACTCTIHRKDRAHPTRVTEYMDECRRPGVGPWQSHPRRMLRHKALIQCARIAFGFTGIVEPDEAERIAEIDMGAARIVEEAPHRTPPEIPPYPREAFEANLGKWRAMINSGRKTAEQIISMVETKGMLTAEQKATICGADSETGEVVEHPQTSVEEWISAYAGEEGAR
jgi:phage recombination protein Bet